PPSPNRTPPRTPTPAEPARAYSRHASPTISRVDLEQAACRDTDLEIFFSIDEADEAKAKRICHRCPVRWERLTYALATRQRHGIWRGLSPQRPTLLSRRLRQGASAGTAAAAGRRLSAPAQPMLPTLVRRGGLPVSARAAVPLTVRHRRKRTRREWDQTHRSGGSGCPSPERIDISRCCG